MGYKVLSWDVGIKNLAYCLMEWDPTTKKVSVCKWDIVSLVDPPLMCQGTRKNGNKRCTSKASLSCELEDKIYAYCGQHKSQYFNPIDDSWINKNYQPVKPTQRCQHKINKRLCDKKAHKYSSIEDISLCNIHAKQRIHSEEKRNSLTKIKSKKCANERNFDLSMALITKLDAVPELVDVDLVLIENQPSLLNPVMKTIASFVFQYFVTRGCVDIRKRRIEDVRFFSPSNKLKVNADNSIEAIRAIKKKQKSDKSKEVYKMTKELAVQYTKQLLKNEPKWIKHLSTYKKQDDLCDSFLQGYYHLSKVKEIAREDTKFIPKLPPVKTTSTPKKEKKPVSLTPKSAHKPKVIRIKKKNHST